MSLLGDLFRLGLTVFGMTFGPWGALVGNLVGSLLFPTKLPGVTGPRLDDLRVQSSALGAPIPVIYGCYAVSGNVIWSTGLIETVSTRKVGNSLTGRQRVTEYSYKASFAIGLCEGEIAGVLRIWADAKCIYDKRPQQSGESDADYAARMAASETLEAFFDLYLGTQTQTADATIEASQGAGNVPGYRGLAYIVFTDLQLEEYGNRIPNFRFEVYTDGTENCATVTDYANDLLLPWSYTSNDPRNPLNVHSYYRFSDGSYFAYGEQGVGSTAYDTLQEALDDAAAIRGKAATFYYGYSIKHYEAGGLTGTGLLTLYHDGYGYEAGPKLTDYDRLDVVMHFNDLETGNFGGNGYQNDFAGGTSLAAQAAAAGLTGAAGEWVHTNHVLFGGTDSGADAGVMFTMAYDTGTEPPDYDIPAAFDVNVNAGYTGWSISAGVWGLINPDQTVLVQRVPRTPLRPSEDPDYVAVDGLTGFYISPDGVIVQDTAWVKETATYKVLQSYDEATESGGHFLYVNKYPLGPARPSTHADYNVQAFWEAAYTAAVTRGEIASGLTYGVDYPVTQAYGYKREYQVCPVTVATTTLGEIVADICSRAGLTAGEIDVTQLTQTVRGYVLTRPMAAREPIEQLRAFGLYDAVESDAKLKFVVRGGASVATLTAYDLRAHPSGGEVPSAVETSRAQDVELPRLLRVSYASPERDYEPGQQYSARLTTDAVNATDVELPVAMDDDEAAQLADKLLFDAWAARNSYSLYLDLSWLKLEPTDPIVVPVDGQAERMRIVSIEHTLPGLIKAEAVRDDDGAFTSYATGTTPSFTPAPGPAVAGPTEMVLLDLPPIADTDDDAGYYVACRGYLGGWGGATIYRSADGGASYQSVAAVVTAATIGTISDLAPGGTTEVPDGPTGIWDDGNTITVDIDSGSVSSSTIAAVLEGANLAAIGADGRWELIQFVTVTPVYDNRYQLTGLLRGRHGTEHNVGTATNGDRFVLLNTAVERVPLEEGAIGRPRLLKAATIGETIDLVTAQTFTGSGIALKPFSPTSVAGQRDSSGNLTISWIRRNRLGEEMPDGDDIAMSESVEDYEVEILTSGGDVLRTISVSDTSASYTANQQTADFGSAQTSVSVKVYQLSTVVGRGYPAEATV